MWMQSLSLSLSINSVDISLASPNASSHTRPWEASVLSRHKQHSSLSHYIQTGLLSLYLEVPFQILILTNKKNLRRVLMVQTKEGRLSPGHLDYPVANCKLSGSHISGARRSLSSIAE